MNRSLQKIQNILEQNNNLGSELKQSLIEALQPLYKELEITSFKLEKTEQVKKTTAILLEETIQELEQKRKAVEDQNRELEIETALERVRAIALSMKNPADMVDVCRTISDQLEQLNVTDIRNIQTAIIDDLNGTYLNYEYFTPYKTESILEIETKLHPVVEEFANEILKSKDAFFTKTFEGQALREWIKYRKKTNQNEDPILETSKSIHYYFYSIGPGALGISTYSPLNDQQIKVFKRFRNVFELAYHRFLDIEKAEIQAREARIETSLERIRATAMSMRKADELLDVVEIISKELCILGILEIRNTNINIFNDDMEKFLNYEYSEYVGKTVYEVYYDSHPSNLQFVKRMKKHAEDFMITEFSGNDLEEWKEWIKNQGQKMDPALIQADNLYYYDYSIGTGSIGISTISPINKDHLEILNRIRNVFNLAYQRYTDISLAEAQAREAQIEAALERVRSKAMAMHGSEDLAETVDTFFSELSKLNVIPHRCGVGIVDADTQTTDIRATTTTHKNEIKKIAGKLKLSGHPVLDNIFEHWKMQKEYHPVLRGKEIKDYYKVMNPQIAFPDFADDEVQYGYYFYFEEGGVFAWTDTELTKDELQIFRRYTSVLSLTYRRYIDLKEAEAQAKEAQIEAALERVRSLALGMRKSEEVGNVTDRLFAELTKLSVDVSGCSIVVIDEDNDRMDLWRARSNVAVKPFESSSINASMSILKKYMPDWAPTFLKAIKKRKNILIDELSAERRSQFIRAISEQYNYSNAEKSKLFLNTPEEMTAHYLFFKLGYLALLSDKKLSDEKLSIARKFIDVFDFAYTRFLDIKNAETQAREAQIEASLERVRSNAMSMHSPEDLSNTVNVFFKEIKTLGIVPIRCGVGQIDEATRTTNLTTTTSSQQGKSFEVIGKVRQTGHPVLDGIFENWKLQKEYHPILKGQEIKKYYSVMNAQIPYPDYPEDLTQYGNIFYFKEGFVFAWTENKLTEEHLQIFRRFTSVLSLTYRRFIDLKQAEARARESEQQASLDRVRAEIASMRTTEDLEKITPLIWKELTALGMPFFRCGIFIIDESDAIAHGYLSTPAGKSLGTLHLKIGTGQWIDEAISHWKKGKIFHGQWSRKEFKKWTQKMLQEGFVKNQQDFQDGKEAPKNLYLQLLPFTQGMLYVGSKSPLSKEEIDLAQKLANAFSVAYTRYEDFQKLEAANERKTLELEEARQLQLAMLPKKLPELPNLDIAVHMQTATEVGGDYYDFSQKDDESINIAIGDATGHGMKAGIMVSSMKSIFTTNSSKMDIESFFAAANSGVKIMGLKRMMMGFTMLNINKNNFKLINAGMPPVFLYHKNSGTVEELTEHGLPIGAMSLTQYHTTKFSFTAGDTLLMLTDGMPELQNHLGEMYSYDRIYSGFQKVAEKSSQEIVDYYKDECFSWLKKEELKDDVTFVVIKFKS